MHSMSYIFKGSLAYLNAEIVELFAGVRLIRVDGLIGGFTVLGTHIRSGNGKYSHILITEADDISILP